MLGGIQWSRSPRLCQMLKPLHRLASKYRVAMGEESMKFSHTLRRLS